MAGFDKTQKDIVARFMAEHDVPGIGAALVRDGEVAACEGFGFADVGAGRPVTPDTLFVVASLTKSFTCVSAMQQVEAGRLNLDTPVRQYLPWLVIGDETLTDGLTVRRLLSHSGGLGRTGHQDRTREEKDNPFPTREALLRGLHDAVPQCRPGQAFSYSNEGYATAGHVTETLAGKPLEDCFREDIYAPAGMHRSAVSFAEWRADADRALPYGRDGLGPFDTGIHHGPYTVARLIEDYQAFLPTGGVISSAADLARYQMATMDRRGRRIGLSAGGLDQLQSLQAPYGDSGWGYGLGYWIMWSGSKKVIGHSGGLPGASTYSMMVPGEGAGVVVLTNRSDVKAFTLAEMLMNTLVGTLWRNDPHAPLPIESRFPQGEPDELAEYVGEYRFRKGPASILATPTSLVLSSPSRYDGPVQRIELKRVAPDLFLGLSLGQCVPFFRDADGQLTGFGLSGYRYQRT